MADENEFNQRGCEGEAFLNQLAYQTFLRDWCFPAPRRPNDNKEICDLLVLFDGIALICAVKNTALGADDEFRQQDVAKNVRQLNGARRYLEQRSEPFNLTNPRGLDVQYWRDEVEEVYLLSFLVGDEAERYRLSDEYKDHSIHVFNRSATGILFRELDTMVDFVAYLRERTLLIESDSGLLVQGGEENLLAYYIQQGRDLTALRGATQTLIVDGGWRGFAESAAYRARGDANRISYCWDDLINNTHRGDSPEYARIARVMARPNRLERRLLGSAFGDAWERASADTEHDVFRRVLESNGVTYCFLFLDEECGREARVAQLEALMVRARASEVGHPTVVGIATEKQLRPECSYDFGLMIQEELTDDFMEEVRRTSRAGVLRQPRRGTATVDEFPPGGQVAE